MPITDAKTESGIRHLMKSRFFFGQNRLILSNVFVLGSPWESDLVAITEAFYWTEYEIKTSRNDFTADFRKSINYSGRGNKHAVYASTEAIERKTIFGIGHHGIIPKPSHFYFVTPAGLVNETDVPDHCGLIQVDPESERWNPFKIIRSAPRLKNSTKLSARSIFNLCRKSARCQ